MIQLWGYCTKRMLGRFAYAQELGKTFPQLYKMNFEHSHLGQEPKLISLALFAFTKLGSR